MDNQEKNSRIIEVGWIEGERVIIKDRGIKVQADDLKNCGSGLFYAKSKEELRQQITSDNPRVQGFNADVYEIYNTVLARGFEVRFYMLDEKMKRRFSSRLERIAV